VILVLAIVLGLGLHLLLGWQWTIAAGLIAGLLARRFGALLGAIAVGLAWALLILYNYIVAPSETGRMIDIMGSLFGNLSPPLLVGSTVLLGTVIGLLGGSIGAIIRGFFPGTSPERQSSEP
jgi:hypothetical protein